MTYQYIKFCNLCKCDKPYTEFFKDRSRKDGFANKCKNCDKAHGRQWVEKNREKRREIVSRSYYKNYEKSLESAKKYRSTNREKCRARVEDWRQRNKGAKAASEAKRRSTKIQSCPTWANLDEIRQIYVSCESGYHVDHIIPLNGKNVCGLHVEYNLQYLPAKDNILKSNSLQEENYE